MSLSAAIRSAPRDADLEELLEEMTAGGLVTAAAALVASPERLVGVATSGRTRREGGRAVRLTDLFDLASLSKPFAATLALALDAKGHLPLDARLSEIWGRRVPPGLSTVALEHLLRHRSGLRSWTPLYRRCRSRRAVVAYLLSEDAVGDRRERYGDLDFVLWGLSAERALGEPYETLLHRHVLRPLGLGGVVSSPGERSSVVGTVLGNERERSLAAAQQIAVGKRGGPPTGVVQDGNARFLGGIAAHAGLFASAPHLWRLAGEWLAPSRLLNAEVVRAALDGGRTLNLGWRRRTLRGSGGGALSAASFGHVGFTGGSLFVDPENDRIMVLLAHRVSATVDLSGWRREFHRQALR